ncbi:MAG: GNAT family N-acetyltransferase [Campylobacterales bacterium]|nr:GNAT family N-acetyltransferase [Campylobacterales bacterium]
MGFEILDFSPQDSEELAKLAVSAFEQYKDVYDDWDVFISRIAAMPSLVDTSEIIVAKIDDEIVGAIAYVPPHKPKAEFFEPEWAVIRMLVVAPKARGQGIGKALTNECIKRAKRDGAKTVALHTSHIMQTALAMYLRMGFLYKKEAPDIFGVKYEVYTLSIV